MKIIKHGKYYNDTKIICCRECFCLYQIKKEDIKKYEKPKKIRVGWIDCYWKEKRNYYTLCPECNNDNELTDTDYFTITKTIKKELKENKK